MSETIEVQGATLTKNKNGSTTVTWPAGNSTTFAKGVNLELTANESGPILTVGNREAGKGASDRTSPSQTSDNTPTTSTDVGVGDSESKSQNEKRPPDERPSEDGTYLVITEDGTAGIVIYENGIVQVLVDSATTAEGVKAIKDVFDGKVGGQVVKYPTNKGDTNGDSEGDKGDGTGDDSDDDTGDDTGDDSDNDTGDDTDDDSGEPADGSTEAESGPSGSMDDDYNEGSPSIETPRGYPGGATFGQVLNHRRPESDENEAPPSVDSKGQGSDLEHARGDGSPAPGENEDKPSMGVKGFGTEWYNALGGKDDAADGWGSGNHPKVILPLTALNMSAELFNCMCSMTSAEFFVAGPAGALVRIPRSGVLRASACLKLGLQPSKRIR